ncbi:hypothetical protein B0H16DRAFT_492144 [Mycena metata]|uniref:Fungal N-terminal domain-containing protein n=1 Tax=Mycena metata TaxID=1033252 RepID=A0AAD7NJF1_9AGAR|nr:hypothetical protein B0H16DRAFT_492144 [Mycena metata]
MAPPTAASHIRLTGIATCLATAAATLDTLSDALGTPFLGTISATVQSLLDYVETLQRNKDDCVELLDHARQLLDAIISVLVNSNTSGEMPPLTLKQIGKFTETLHKIHAFVEAQQGGLKIKNFFRKGEMNTLLKDCKSGLVQAQEFFKINSINFAVNVQKMQQDSEARHQQALAMIEGLSDTASNRTSHVGKITVFFSSLWTYGLTFD